MTEDQKQLVRRQVRYHSFRIWTVTFCSFLLFLYVNIILGPAIEKWSDERTKRIKNKYYGEVSQSL